MRMITKSRMWAVPLVAAGAIALALTAGAKPKALSPGVEMPDFSLTDTSGKTHTLSEYRGKIVVIDFLSKDCPYSRGAAPYLSSVAKKYGEKGIVFLGINSNNGTTQADNAQYSESADIAYPILRDEMNEYADAVGATRTPEIYVVDKNGMLVYQGAVDDRKIPTETGETPYLTNALDELLAGKSVSSPHESAWGCSIKRVTKKPGASTD